MRFAVPIARILLGLLFTLTGLLGLYFEATLGAPPPPAMAGLAGQFMDLIFKSHYAVVVDIFQIAGGVMLLVNRYVMLGLVILAAILVNILTFHMTMNPEGIVLPLVAVALWCVVAWSQRAKFALLFAPG